LRDHGPADVHRSDGELFGGGVYSNAEDLLAFSRALLGDRLLSDELKARLVADDGDQHALGWGVEHWSTDR